MLTRFPDWFSYLGISAADTARAKALAAEAVVVSAGMMHLEDLHALGAALLYARPSKIFEIGTYMGASSNFFLTLLPETKVISIAYVTPAEERKRGKYNNVDLTEDRVGSLVAPENRARFTQLIGDSHKIDPKEFVTAHGKMSFVFIDGDHSRIGVGQDTELAQAIITTTGSIGWHDANPKRKYIESREFLEQDLKLNALATADTFIGGVAFWSAKLEKKLAA